MQTVNIRSLVFTALFAALFIVLSIQHMRITATPVPITFQTLGVIMAGVFLRPKQAFASIFAVIILTSFGLPLFSGKGGISTLIGYTGGFIFAFPFCALFISMAMERLLRNERIMRNKALAAITLFVVFELFSSLLSYVPGIPWMMHVLNMPLDKAIKVGFLPFIIGDAAKSAVGVVIVMSLYSYIVQLRSSAISKEEKEAGIQA